MASTTWRGDWDAGTAYAPGDGVNYAGKGWFCATANTGQAPGSGGGWALGDEWAQPPPGEAHQPLTAGNNLSDLASASAARTNLGLGSAAIQPASAFASVFSPLSYGAAGDGTTDDTTAVQAAFTAAAAAGGTVDITGQQFLCTSPVTLAAGTRVRGGTGITAACGSLVNTTTDLFSVAGAVGSVTFDGGYYSASAGHVFNAATASCSRWNWRNAAMVQSGAGFRIWHMTGGTYIDMTVGEGCYLQAAPGATVAPWYAAGAGSTNSNTWRDHRVSLQSASGGTVPFYHVESTAAGAYSSNNRFSGITAEQCSGGVITALSASHLTCDNVVGYDVTSYAGSLFTIGAGAGSLNSLNVTVRDCGRAGGTLASAAVYDISAPSVSSLVIENTGPEGGAASFNVPATATFTGYGPAAVPAIRPASLGLLAWTGYPGYAITTDKPATAGVFYTWLIEIPAPGTVNSITYGIDVIGNTLSNAWLGLYSAGSSISLLAQCTTDQSTNMSTSVTSFTASLSSPYAVTSPGLYRIGLVIGSATTMPTFEAVGTPASPAFTNMGIPVSTNFVAGSSGSGLTALPAGPVTSLASVGGLPLFVLK